MNDPLAAADVQQLIQYTMKTAGAEKELREVSDGINMSYNFVGKYVTFDRARLKVSHQELAPACPFEQFVQAITLHELGHAMDQEALDASLARTMEIFTMKKSYPMRKIFQTPELLSMLIEEDEMNIGFETTAWDHAALMNEAHQLVEPEYFEVIRKNSLKTYEDLHKEGLDAYERLTSVQTAVQ